MANSPFKKARNEIGVLHSKMDELASQLRNLERPILEKIESVGRAAKEELKQELATLIGELKQDITVSLNSLSTEINRALEAGITDLSTKIEHTETFLSEKVSTKQRETIVRIEAIQRNLTEHVTNEINSSKQYSEQLSTALQRQLNDGFTGLAGSLTNISGQFGAIQRNLREHVTNEINSSKQYSEQLSTALKIDFIRRFNELTDGLSDTEGRIRNDIGEYFTLLINALNEFASNFTQLSVAHFEDLGLQIGLVGERVENNSIIIIQTIGRNSAEIQANLRNAIEEQRAFLERLITNLLRDLAELIRGQHGEVLVIIERVNRTIVAEIQLRVNNVIALINSFKTDLTNLILNFKQDLSSKLTTIETNLTNTFNADFGNLLTISNAIQVGIAAILELTGAISVEVTAIGGIVASLATAVALITSTVETTALALGVGISTLSVTTISISDEVQKVKNTLDKLTLEAQDAAEGFFNKLIKLLPTQTAEEVCCKIVGTTYYRWDLDTNYAPTLVFLFKEVKQGLDRKHTQVKAKLPYTTETLPSDIVDKLHQAIVKKGSLKYSRGALRASFVHPVYRWKTTIFVTKKDEAVKVLAYALDVMGLTLDLKGFSFTEGRNKITPTKLTKDLKDIQHRKDNPDETFEVILTRVVLLVNNSKSPTVVWKSD